MHYKFKILLIMCTKKPMETTNHGWPTPDKKPYTSTYLQTEDTSWCPFKQRKFTSQNFTTQQRKDIHTFISAAATQWSRIPSKICATSALTMSSDVGASRRFHRVLSRRSTRRPCVVWPTSWLLSDRNLLSCLLLLTTAVDPSLDAAVGIGTTSLVEPSVSRYCRRPDRFCKNTY